MGFGNVNVWSLTPSVFYAFLCFLNELMTIADDDDDDDDVDDSLLSKHGSNSTTKNQIQLFNQCGLDFNPWRV